MHRAWRTTATVVVVIVKVGVGVGVEVVVSVVVVAAIVVAMIIMIVLLETVLLVLVVVVVTLTVMVLIRCWRQVHSKDYQGVLEFQAFLESKDLSSCWGTHPGLSLSLARPPARMCLLSFILILYHDTVSFHSFAYTNFVPGYGIISFIRLHSCSLPLRPLARILSCLAPLSLP